MTLNHICKRNPLSFNLVPLKHSIDSNLTLAIPILLTLLSSAYILLFIYLIIFLNFFIVTTYEFNNLELSTILVFSSCNMVTFNIITISTLKGIALIPCYTMTLVVNI